MDKSISQLIPDIYELVGRKDGWFNEVLASDLGKEISLKVQERFADTQRQGGLRLSQMGNRCPRALWYSVHHPELAEPLQPWAQIKFMYGDIIEALVISLAKASGHTVEGEQDVLYVDGVPGHRDCVIDGYLVDVKSTNSHGFKVFKEKKVIGDLFLSSYLDQLDGYLVGSADDPIVKHKDSGFIFAVDKQLGHMVLYEHTKREASIRGRIRDYKRIVDNKSPPACECGTIPDGKSGNIRLDTKASYSPYKYCCFPSLRTFIYSDGPRHLTRVVRLPDVPEVDKNGKLI